MSRRSAPPRLRRVRLLFLHPEVSVLMLTVLLCAYLGSTNQYFLDKQNLLNITEAVAVIGIAAALATYVVIIGGLDLTPVTVFVIAGVVVIKTIDAGWPLFAVILSGILAGGAIGLVNGILISVYELNPVIVTLGTNFLFTGVAFIATAGEGQLISDEAFLDFWARKLPWDVPLVSVMMVAVFAAAYVTLRYTKLGVHVYAIGGDINAARLNGIAVVRVRLVVYLLAGLAAGLAGVVEAGRSGAVAPFGALSQTDLLKIIAAVIIGGTALSGGRGTVWGTFLGSLLFGIIANGLVLKNISNFYQPVVIGGILLAAVLLERMRERLAVES